MRTRAFDITALVAVLATGTGLAWTAYSMPRILAQTSFLTAALGASACVGVVLWSRRRLRGVMQVQTRRDQRREEALRVQVATLEGQVRMLTEQLREAASTDELTGVLKRRAVLERLDEVSQRDARLERPLAVLLVDVEGFRRINAQRGRVVGDEVLKTVARALKSVTRGTDWVGRMDGDEFAVVLGECEDPGPVVSRLFLALTDGEEKGREGEVPVRVSVGSVVVSDLSTGLDLERVFQLAGEALNSVRGTGTSRCGTRVLDRPGRKSATA